MKPVDSHPSHTSFTATRLHRPEGVTPPVPVASYTDNPGPSVTKSVSIPQNDTEHFKGR